MVQRIIIIVVVAMFGTVTLAAQTKEGRTKTIRGTVADHNQEAIEGVQIFVDMVGTKVETNARGRYKLKTTTAAQLITAWHPDLGIINWNYGGEKKIDFVFPENSAPVSLQELVEIGYTTKQSNSKKRNGYGDYSTILEILDNTFNQVRVHNGTVIVGRGGPHTFNADQEPLVLVNNVPTSIASMNSIATTDVELIKVVHKGSELAEYGFRAVNGVIIIKLKDGNAKS